MVGLEMQLVHQQPPPAKGPSVAQQLLADFVAAQAKAKAKATKAKALSKTKAKAKAEASAPPAKKARVAPAVAKAAPRAKGKLDHEKSRKAWRCRFPDGTSQGFSYTGDEDKEAKRQEALARLEAWTPKG